eukprot:1670786-Alexandrium_andersonii.AAC.1
MAFGLSKALHHSSRPTIGATKSATRTWWGAFSGLGKRPERAKHVQGLAHLAKRAQPAWPSR